MPFRTRVFDSFLGYPIIGQCVDDIHEALDEAIVDRRQRLLQVPPEIRERGCHVSFEEEQELFLHCGIEALGQCVEPTEQEGIKPK